MVGTLWIDPTDLFRVAAARAVPAVGAQQQLLGVGAARHDGVLVDHVRDEGGGHQLWMVGTWVGVIAVDQSIGWGPSPWSSVWLAHLEADGVEEGQDVLAAVLQVVHHPPRHRCG